MQVVQWIVLAATAIFVALVGYFQWRTAQSRAVLDLFEKRHAIFEVVRSAVGKILSSSNEFDQNKEIEFLQSMERAYFLFGDDVEKYLEKLWEDITDARTADAELNGPCDNETRRKIIERRRAAMTRIGQFHSEGKPVFARYMRFSQTVPTNLRLPR